MTYNPLASDNFTRVTLSTNDVIGNILLKQMQKENITQSELAKRIGWSPAIVNQIMRGLKQPSHHFVCALMEKLNLEETEKHAVKNILPREKKRRVSQGYHGNNFAGLVRAKLDALNLFQKELARRIGMTDSRLSQILNGHVIPSDDVIEAIIKALPWSDIELKRMNDMLEPPSPPRDARNCHCSHMSN